MTLLISAKRKQSKDVQTHKDEVLTLDGLGDFLSIPELGLDHFNSLFRELLSGGLGRVTSDGADTVGLVALEQVSEHATTLDAGGSKDGDRSGAGIGRSDHGYCCRCSFAVRTCEVRKSE